MAILPPPPDRTQAQRQTRSAAHRYPVPHRTLHGATHAEIAAHLYLHRRLYDHRPRNHPTGLTDEHDTEITTADLAAALHCSPDNAARTLKRIAGHYQIERRPGRPHRIRHHPDVEERGRAGQAWIPWTTDTLPPPEAAAVYALASWSGWRGRPNYARMRQTTSRPPAAELARRAGQHGQTFRRSLRRLQDRGATTGELADRTLRLHADRIAAPRHAQEAARRIPPGHRPHPGRPNRIKATEPPTADFAAPIERNETRENLEAQDNPGGGSPHRTDRQISSGLTKQYRTFHQNREARRAAVRETRWRTANAPPIDNPQAFTAILTWCYTRPTGTPCGRHHQGPCGEEAAVLHGQRRTEHRHQLRDEERKHRFAEIMDELLPPAPTAAPDSRRARLEANPNITLDTPRYDRLQAVFAHLRQQDKAADTRETPMPARQRPAPAPTAAPDSRRARLEANPNITPDPPPTDHDRRIAQFQAHARRLAAARPRLTPIDEYRAAQRPTPAPTAAPPPPAPAESATDTTTGTTPAPAPDTPPDRRRPAARKPEPRRPAPHPAFARQVEETRRQRRNPPAPD